MKHYEFWFVVGSQTLYGDDVLTTVANRAEEMAQKLSAVLPYPLKYKVTAKSSAEITQVVKEANYDDNCAGIVTWCHTFSPSKMWINGLDLLQKPWLHFATQYNREIPNEEIDMDFMNLNQAAHGDREHGFIGARLRKPRKVIAGYWQDADVQARIGSWMKAAIGVAVSKDMKVMRFGDNMRNVAVTEGDKVEVQKKLGWEVNTWAVGDLVKEMNAVTEAEIDALMDGYREKYDFATDDIAAIRYQAREEIAMKKMMDAEGCKAFSNTFQDLYGMEQLPGLASQHLMAQGYGYGGEGDWKVAAMTAILKAMGENGNGASAFMEDYTYHLVKGQEYSLGAHMLEVCPSVAAGRPRIETHFLGIGMNEKDPARLVFEGKPGKAVVVSLIDMGGRLRLIVQDIEAVKPIMPMPNLPVARVMWRAMPDLTTGVECWITAGGAHHTVLSYDVTAEQLRDWARMMEIEFVHITKDTTVSAAYTLNTVSYAVNYGVISDSDDTANGTLTAKNGTKTFDSRAEQPAGSTIVFTAQPEDGYQVKGRYTPADGTTEIADTASEQNRYTITNLTDEATVYVAFEPIPTYDITISTTGFGHVTAAVNGTETEITDGKLTVSRHANVVLTAVPDEKQYLTGWTLDTETKGNSSLSLTLDDVTDGHTVKADFAASQLVTLKTICRANGTLTAQAGHGDTIETVDASSESGIQVEKDKKVVLRVTPKPDFMVKMWTVNGTVQNNLSNTLTIENLSENTEVEVAFEPLVLHSVPQSGMGYTVTVVEKIPNDYGNENQIRERGTVTFTVSPESGKYLMALKVNNKDCLAAISNNGNENKLRS